MYWLQLFLRLNMSNTQSYRKSALFVSFLSVCTLHCGNEKRKHVERGRAQYPVSHSCWINPEKWIWHNYPNHEHRLSFGLGFCLNIQYISKFDFKILLHKYHCGNCRIPNSNQIYTVISIFLVQQTILDVIFAPRRVSTVASVFLRRKLLLKQVMCHALNKGKR